MSRTNDTDKVVRLDKKKLEEAHEKAKEHGQEDVEKTDSFFDLVQKNAANKEREKKERLKKNKSVLKSYGIK